ncbi:MAG TPA: hypothetical protein VFC09_09710 [Candidatus Dormibacteraeota bacterium]|nr:hypothetical protein [Candidatus Dormibacteraeota bacterium]
MKQVWKYPLNTPPGGVVEHRMPADAELLTVQEEHGSLVLWALVDPGAAGSEARRFAVVGTGHDIAVRVGRHLGTVRAPALYGGSVVLHVFEVQET